MNQASFSVAVGSTDIMDEAMNVLSDSVIYAFQQAVYHLTKVNITVDPNLSSSFKEDQILVN